MGRFSSILPGRIRSTQSAWFSDSQQHPDLPLHPPALPTSKTPSPSPQPAPINRSASVIERPYYNSGYAGDRRSLAVAHGAYPPTAYSPDDIGQASPQISGALSRSQTVVRKTGSGLGYSDAGEANYSPVYEASPEISPPTHWTPDFSQLPSPNEQPETGWAEGMPMSAAQYPGNTPGKTSSDSAQQPTLDRWSQRRLQRLNTEQGFREQRQGGGQQALSSAAPSSDTPGGFGSNPSNAQYPSAAAQPHSTLHQPAQPHPAQQSGYQPARTGQASQPNLGLAIQSQSSTNTSRSANYPAQDNSRVPSTQYSPPDSGPQYAFQDTSRPSLVQSQSRSFSLSQQGAADDSSMSNNGNKAHRTTTSNRQSVHNALTARDGQQAFNASVVPSASQGQPYKGTQALQGDVSRGTPQPLQVGDEMTEEEVVQLVKDHKELREKYTKVKKYYFEKEDQVKQLQNSLAHQRLSQSKTSLDDSEYTTRFNRLDGLIAQLAFSIRKKWVSMPPWLLGSINKDAIEVGKQEMIVAGRALISHWLVEEVFNKYFHPDLEPTLSAQLRSVQRNIRRFAPVAHTTEEEEYLTSKVVNWRLATLEGLQESLRSSQCPENRQQLTDMLKNQLVDALTVHLRDPPPDDLEGGVHMIIELVVSIAIHLPLESRDVVIEYFPPGMGIINDQMKVDAVIPPLATSVREDAAERASMKSATSDAMDLIDNGTGDHTKKRGMLSAITGAGGKSKGAAQGKHVAAGGSTSSLNRPESSQGLKEEGPPRVRMAAGIGVRVRGRSVLVKAAVFST